MLEKIKNIKLEKHHYTALVGWIAKIFTTIFTLVNTRLLIANMGIKGFAGFSIILSLLGWITLLNFGIPNAIQNIIAEYRVKNKNADLLFIISAFLLPFWVFVF
jgi:O-antigen/teichoic acid export membrane protein